MIGGTLAVLIIAIALAAWRLSSGPVSLAFLAPYVADALNDAASPYRVEFDDTILAWAGWERTLDIRIIGVRAIRGESGVVASVPEIAFGLSAPALLRGVVAPASLDIIEPVLRLHRNTDGTFELGFGEDGLAPEGVGGDWIADLLAADDPERPLSYLSRVSVVRADISVEDERLRFAWRAPSATVSIRREGAGFAGAADFSLVVGAEHARMKAAARYPGSGDTVQAWLEFADLRPRWFAEQHSTLAVLGLGRLPVSGRLDARLGLDGIARQIAFDIDAGAGTLLLGEWLEGDVDIAGAHARGLVRLEEQRVELDEGFIDLGQTTVSLSGMIEGFNATPRIEAVVAAGELPGNELRRYWPVDLAATTREWIITNITEGTIVSARARFDVTPEQIASGLLPEEAIHTELTLEGFTVDYYHPLPKLQGLNGIATITATTFDIATSGGYYKELRARPGRVHIDDIAGLPLATVDIAVDGPLRDAMDIIAHPRLGFGERLAIERDRISGDAETRLRFVFPTSKRDERTLVVTGTSKLRGVAHPGIFGGYDLSDGDFALELDNQGMSVEGPALLNGAPVALVWREYFETGVPLRRSYEITAIADDAQRAALGMPFADEIEGTSQLALDIDVAADASQHWRGELALDGARVGIPGLHWSKPAGERLAVDFEARVEPGAPVVVAPINATSETLRFAGRAALEPDGSALKRLDIDSLVFAKNNFGGTILPLAEGGYDIALSGRQFDLRPYLRDAEIAGAGDPRQAPLDLTAHFDRMLLLGRRRLDGVDATISQRTGAWELFTLDGTFKSGEAIKARIRPKDRHRIMRVETSDAGAFLQGFGIFDNVTGGTLAIRARLDRTGAKRVADGELRMTDFTVRKAPTFAKMLTLASFTGILDRLNGEGVEFEKLKASFVKRGDDIRISGLTANGSGIGVTLEGAVDLAADTIDVRGDLVPAYFWNRLLEWIPLITGDEGGGLFAFSYQVKGPRSDPEVSLNPLSIIAPGILRGIFEPRLDDESWKELEDDDGGSGSTR